MVCSWHLKEFSASRMERQAGAILHKMSKAMVRNFYFYSGADQKLLEISIGEGHEVIYVFYIALATVQTMD